MATKKVETQESAETLPVETGEVGFAIDPDKASITIQELVTLDHALRDHGTCVADILHKMADSLYGIRV